MSTQASAHAVRRLPHSTPHTPSLQTRVPKAVGGHVAPHAPQFATSELKLTQTVSQGEKPSAQANLQLDFAHTGRPCAGAVQSAPQPPQFCASVLSTTHLLPHTVSPSRQAFVASGRTHVFVALSQT